MEIRIQSVKFDATEKLQSFINKKTEKLAKFHDGISAVEVTLRVIKPETAANKEASIKLIAPKAELFSSKTADSFEEAVDLCCEALQKQIEKAKEKK